MNELNREMILESTHDNPWDAFFAAHKRPYFFKERRYLHLEFPYLQQEQPSLKIVDLGSGYGSSTLPILKVSTKHLQTKLFRF